MKSIRYSPSPLLASRTPVWRSRFLVAAMGLVFCGLLGKAAWVQVVNNGYYQDQGDIRVLRTVELPAVRGRLLDRNGMLLASTVEAPDIWAVPERVPKGDPRLNDLARLLGMPPERLQARLDAREKGYVRLRRQVDLFAVQEIEALGIPGISKQVAYTRVYPEGEATAHVVGFADVDNHGQEGMERSFDQVLAGQPGERRVIRNRLGQVVELVGEEIPPLNGRDVQLSIDAKVQAYAYQKLHETVLRHKARSASAVVLDARSGEVLAMANYPSYVPNDRQARQGPQVRNRAVTDTFEPGSTMKPITVAIALDAGKVSPQTVIDTTPGVMRLDRFTIRDTHNYGRLTVQGVVQKSSNIGALKIGQQMSAQQMWDNYTALGLGRKPELAFPGAAAGSLRSWKSWRPVEQATMSYGYGLSASLLQMAHAYTAFANDGELVPLSLLRRADGEAVDKTRVFSARTARAVRQMLHMVVEPGGTARRARTAGYTVGGKTGTARKQEGRGYNGKKYRAWFVGLAPIDQPEIVVAVMVDEPGDGTMYGGTLAAPVFSDVVQQTLRMRGVRPDQFVEPRIVASVTEDQPS